MSSLSLAEATAVADDVRARLDAGRIDDALALAQATIERTIGHARAIVEHALALALSVVGRSLDALRAAAAAREGFRSHGVPLGELDAMLAMGGVMRGVGDHVSAIQAFEEAEVLARGHGDDLRLGIVLRQIGVCCSLLGRHHQAVSSLGEALDLHPLDAAPREHLATLLSLYNANNRHARTLPSGSVERLDQLEGHSQRWLDLATLAAENGQTRLELMALGNHAITLHDCGRHREALVVLRDLLPLYRQHGMTPNEAICHFEIGRSHESLGEPVEARACYLDAIAMFEVGGQQTDLREALEGLASVEEKLGDHRAALAALRRVRDIEAKADDRTARAAAVQRELRIELAKLASQWHRMASLDPLTGLGNRRALEQWFGEARLRAESGVPMVLLLHDMDHFKSINDGFGHGIGDEVLKRVARLIGAHCRASDLAVRYGGEEFLLALSGVAATDAVDIADRLRTSIAAFDWPSIAPDLRVTVSIGVAGFSETGDVASLLTLADRRLYAAKHGGRDRVVHSD